MQKKPTSPNRSQSSSGYYDDTKKMLNTLRRLNESAAEKRTIREQHEEDYDSNVKDDVAVVNDVDIKLVSSDDLDLELDEQQKTAISTIVNSFRDQVSQVADLRPGFTMTRDQIRLDGVFGNIDLRFVFIAGNDGGVYFNADMVRVDDESIDVINKLFDFDATFRDSMEPLLRIRKDN